MRRALILAAALMVGAAFGQIEFDGVDQYIQMGDAASLNFGAGNYTVALWFKAAGTMNSSDPLVTKRSSAGGNGLEFFFNNPIGSHTIVNKGSAGNLNGYFSEPYANLEDGNWHHLAYGRNGSTTLFAYLDGVEKPITYTASVDCDVDNTEPLELGLARDDSNVIQWTVDGLRVFDTDLTAAQVNQLLVDTWRPGMPYSVYTNALENLGDTDNPVVVYPSAGLVSYYPLDSDGSDIVSTNSGTISGNPFWTDNKYNAANYNSDWVQVPHTSDLTFSSNDAFTVNMFVEVADVGTNPNGEQGIVAKGFNGDLEWGLYLRSTGLNSVRFYTDNNGSWGPANFLDFPIDGTSKDEHMFSVVYDRLSVRLYQDGVLMTNGTFTTAITADTGDFYIGAYYGTLYEHVGTIDEVAIWGRALSDKELAKIYSIGNTGYRP